MTDYATLQDLKDHWPGYTEDKNTEAVQKLLEAQIEINALYPDLEDRVANGDLDIEVVRLVVCRMVKRALEDPATGEYENLNSVTQSQGGFSQTLNFVRSGDGTLYLTKADKRLLGRRDDGRAFSIIPGDVR